MGKKMFFWLFKKSIDKHQTRGIFYEVAKRTHLVWQGNKMAWVFYVNLESFYLVQRSGA